MNDEAYFSRFREQILGIDAEFDSPFGRKRVLYADWTASGRLYAPIERKFIEEIYPWVGNTHTGSTWTGRFMTETYEDAKQVIRRHVHAGPEDVVLFVGSGMTGAINKLQRILGLRISDRTADYLANKPGRLFATEKSTVDENILLLDPTLKPVVFITHMEHHSNHISWLETIVDLEIIGQDAEGLVDLGHLRGLLEKYRGRKHKIASVTACSNVTGIHAPYREIARMMHAAGGLCFVDFACSAPYVDIDMHPKEGEPGAHLDAIFFSPHKFLGGPGSAGVLVFNSNLYTNQAPDQPGGGTVTYTSPWNIYKYVSDIEGREDGGTPPFLQGIRAAFAVKLKEEMGVARIESREKALVERLLNGLAAIPGVVILAEKQRDRLGVVSFYIEGLHYNLGVRILNDRFGIQTRGGCACAGTYGHYLLEVGQATSFKIMDELVRGDSSNKPGWIRVSVHPTQTDAEITSLLAGIKQLAEHHPEWGQDYRYDPKTNEFGLGRSFW